MNESKTTKRNVISHFGERNPEIKLLKLKEPSLIENRLPNIVFTGPNGLRDQRLVVLDKFEIGIGRFSNLRTSNADYLTRGSSGDIIKQRKDYPGEIGWSYEYFRNLYPVSVSCRRYNSGYSNGR